MCFTSQSTNSKKVRLREVDYKDNWVLRVLLYIKYVTAQEKTKNFIIGTSLYTTKVGLVLNAYTFCKRSNTKIRWFG